MLEKRFRAVPAQLFTADGTSNGVITIAGDACALFKVKQHVVISANTLPSITLEIKEIDGVGNIQVGPIPTGKPGVNTSIDARTDISAYTTALSAKIYANEQRRPSIDWAEAMRAMYDEEPVVAMRTIMVDECGNRYNDDNPLPIAFDGTINVGEVEVIGRNGNTIEPNQDGSLNTLNLGSGVDVEWDDEILARDPVTQDITSVTYKKGGITQRVLTLTYDSNENLIDVKKT